MKKIFTIKYRIALLLILSLGLSQFSFAQTTFTTKANGIWSDKNTWDKGSVPGGNDIVNVKHTVTLTSSNTGPWGGSINVNGNGNIIVNSGAIFNGGGAAINFGETNSLTINSGGNVNFYGSGQIFGNVTVKNGGKFDMNTSGAKTFNGKVIVEAGANFKIQNATYNSDVVFGGNMTLVGYQNCNANLTVNTNINADGVTLKVCGGTLTLNANYKINGGSITICNGGTLVLDGEIDNTGGTLTIDDGTLELGGNGTVKGKDPVYSGDNRILIYRQASQFTAGTEWNTAAGKIPTKVIVRMAGNAPLIINSDRTVIGDFIIDSGKVVLANNKTLNIGGNWSKSAVGGFDGGNNSTVNFNGTSATQPQIISSPGTESEFYNLINNNSKGGLQFKDSVGISNKLILSPNSKTILLKDASVTIKSGPTGTANIGQLGAGATITYEDATSGFIVERYLPSKKAWHFLSVPTQGSTFHKAWQEGNDSLKNQAPKGFGTMLTGTKGTKGYDYISPQPSLKYFDNSRQQYIEVSKTDSVMNSSGGYMVFIRGDRSILPTNSTGYSATNLRTKGKIYIPGNAPAPVKVLTNKWALIGNPYPSAIDFNKILVNNVSDRSKLSGTYYIWDANLTGTYSTGAFRTINNGVVTPKEAGYTLQPIQSGEAFFVKNTSAAEVTITLPETVKVDGSSLQPFRTTSMGKVSNEIPEPDAQLRANLYGFSGAVPELIDGVITLFSPEYSNLNDEWNSQKMNNLNSENMGIRSNEQVLVIERKQMPSESDSILYKMNNYKIAPYRFEFIAEKLDFSGQDAFLFDKYLQKEIEINPNGITTYDFNIQSPAGSWDENRFVVVFKKGGALPVTFTNVKAYTKNNDVVIEWTVENESNMRSYTVETSSDGKSFTQLGSVPATNLSSNMYDWLHLNPSAGYHYYRILSTELDGKMAYSKVVRVLVGNNISNAKITIYPNPIKDGVINLQFENQTAGIYQLRLLNTVGQVILNKTISHAGGNSSELLQLNSTITKGIYHLEIYKGSERILSEKIVY